MNKIKIGLLALLIFLGVVDFFVPKEHAAFPLEAIPGFYALFGLLATVLIIAVSKLLGHLLILKKEDYYDH